MMFFSRGMRHVLFAGAVLLAPLQASAEGLTVFAAASMKDVLGAVATEWKAAGHDEITVSLAASSALAKQIEQGAPADIFISADLKWMDYVEKAGLLADGTRKNLLGNAIVLVAPKDSTTSLKIEKGFALADTLGTERLAMGNTDSVPAGVYGKAALTSLGIWDAVKDKVAQAENVRAALLLVSRKEAPLGIVYATDASSDPEVKVVDTFPEDSHEPIVYPVATLKESKNADAAAFIKFLSTPKATEIFKAAGFTALAATN